MKIVIVGTGYVGMSMAVLLSQNNEVVALDIDSKKIDLINQKRSPIKDDLVEKFIAERDHYFKNFVGAPTPFIKLNPGSCIEYKETYHSLSLSS